MYNSSKWTYTGLSRDNINKNNIDNLPEKYLPYKFEL